MDGRCCATPLITGRGRGRKAPTRGGNLGGGGVPPAQAAAFFLRLPRRRWGVPWGTRGDQGGEPWAARRTATRAPSASSPAPPPGVLYTANSPLLFYILPRPLGSSPVALCQRLFLVVALLKSSSSIVTSRHPSAATHLFLAPPFAHDYSGVLAHSYLNTPHPLIPSFPYRFHVTVMKRDQYASAGTGTSAGTSTGTDISTASPSPRHFLPPCHYHKPYIIARGIHIIA